MSRRRATAFAGIARAGTLALGVVVSGCGKKVPERVEIVIWDQMDPSESQLLMDHVRAFEAAHPNIRVVRSQYEVENLRTQFMTAALAGGGPDLVYGPSDNVGPFSVQKIVYALDTIIPADSLAKFHPASFDRVGGHVYALADQLGNHLALVYNMNMLQEPPQTLDELASIAQSLTLDTNGDGRPDQYGLVYDTSEPFWLVPFLGAFGGWVMDDANRPTLAGQPMADALAYLVRLKNELGVVPRESDRQLADTMFKEGKAAMILNGPWSWSAYREAGIPLGIARIPQNAATRKWATPMVGSKGYCVNAKVSPEKLPHVLALLHHLTSPAATAEYAQLLILPSRLEALESAAVRAEPLLAASRAQYDVGRRMPVAPEMRAVWDAMRPPLQLVMNGKLDPAAAATQMQQDAVAKIASMQR